MAEVSNSRSHPSLLSRARVSSVDIATGPVSLPEPLSPPHYTHQSSQERHTSSNLLPRGSSSVTSGSMSLPEPLPSTSNPPSCQSSVEPQSSPSQSRQSSRERLQGSPPQHQSPPAHMMPAGPSVVTESNWSPTNHKGIAGCTAATLENCRYRLRSTSMSDHDNEDRHFTMNKNNTQIFGVFDGHDGSRAVGFASNYMMELFNMDSWKKAVDQGQDVAFVLGEIFKDTEREFFKSISRDTKRKEEVARRIPEGMTSYQAQLNYPMEVAELQKLEPKITGGCTAVLAIIVSKQLCVANVGDSRAIVIREKLDGTMYAEQLSVDHGVQNEEELTRLERLGLSRDNLKRAGRLGMHENTRSFGDYYVKRGYKDVDTLVSARQPPGIAIPHITTPVTIDQSFRYLVLMTDGVYKSIEGQFKEEGAIDANKVLTNMILKEDTPGRNPAFLADTVLARISKAHEQAYQTAAAQDPRSTVAVNCRKRDDMTCVIYKFSPPKAAPRKRPQLTTQESHSAPPSLSRV